jgi:hypothetical protein
LFDTLFDSCGFHRPVVDEQEDGCPFGAIVRIADPSIAFEAPSIILSLEVDELIRNCAPVHLADTINCASTDGH